jgi:hypothetical protein
MIICMALQDYPPSELQPRQLSREQTEDPMLVIQDFFEYDQLPEIRQQLWDMLKTAATGNYCKTLSRRERSDLFYFYEQLVKLVEAAHLLYRNAKKSTG